MNNMVKAGDRLILHARYVEADEDGELHYALLDGGTTATPMTQAEFKCARPEVGTLMPEKPKYDPCRLFKKGDKVRVVEWNGRSYWDRDHSTELTTGCICEVNEDEKSAQEEGWVSVDYQEQIRYVPPCFLELITPVEEIEPYYIEQSTSKNYWEVWKKDSKKGRLLIAMFHKNHPHSKETAEAECDRLNAEYRKEQNNG